MSVEPCPTEAKRPACVRLGPLRFHEKFGTARAQRYFLVSPEGNEYDAKAILFAARRLQGLDGENVDFDGDVETVAIPLMQMGYFIVDSQSRNSLRAWMYSHSSMTSIL